MTEYGVRYRSFIQGKDEWIVAHPKHPSSTPLTANDQKFTLRSSLNDAMTLAARHPHLSANYLSAEVVPLESVCDLSDHDNKLMHEVLKRRVKIRMDGDDYDVIDCSLERLPQYANLTIQSHRQKTKELQDNLADERVQTIGLTAEIARLKADIARLQAGRKTEEEAFTINIGDSFRCIQNSTTNSPRPIEKGAIGTVTYLNGVSTFMSFGEIADYVSNETLRKDFEKLPALVTTYSSVQQAMQSTQFCCPQCGGDHFGSRNEGSIFVCHGHETYNINDHSFKPPCGWSGLRSECFKNIPVDNYSTTPTVVPANEHPLAELTNVIKYWNSPWTPGVWWYEFDDYPKYFSRFDPAMDYGKGRWCMIDKPPFTPRPDPLDEQAKKVMADLCNTNDLTRDVGAIIKKHFTDWEPKE